LEERLRNLPVPREFSRQTAQGMDRFGAYCVCQFDSNFKLLSFQA
jgi:hypothetical protein